MDLTVACVYRPGGGFSPEYVYRLQRAARKYCSVSHRFACLTTQDLTGVECIPLVKNWIGWWSKLELFYDHFDGQVVYLDLDTMIIDDVTDIFTWPQRGFAAGSNWKMDTRTHMNSAVMIWDADLDFSHIPGSFHPDMIPEYSESWQKWGDQAFIHEHLQVPWDNLFMQFPGRIANYKMHVRRPGFAPEGTSIVCFSGKPRPHTVGWRLPDGRES